MSARRTMPDPKGDPMDRDLSGALIIAVAIALVLLGDLGAFGRRAREGLHGLRGEGDAGEGG